jgi:hypothetical protein
MKQKQFQYDLDQKSTMKCINKTLLPSYKQQLTVILLYENYDNSSSEQINKTASAMSLKKNI